MVEKLINLFKDSVSEVIEDNERLVNANVDYDKSCFEELKEAVVESFNTIKKLLLGVVDKFKKFVSSLSFTFRVSGKEFIKIDKSGIKIEKELISEVVSKVCKAVANFAIDTILAKIFM